MATNTAGTVARDLGIQAVHYMRKGITFADLGTTVVVGTLPAGAMLLKALSGVYVTTAFTGTTPTLDVGPTSDSGHDLWGSALSLASLGYITLDEAVSAYTVVSSDTEVSADYNGTDDTVGAAEIVICYILDNDA
jgi:hypothetical protein